MLPAGTTKRDLHMFKIALYEPRYMVVHQGINGLQESQYLAVLHQEIDHRLIQARHGLILFVFTGVMGTAAVKHIAASVAGSVRRDAALKGERVDRY